MSTPEQFHALMREVTEQIGPADLDQALEDRLNRDLGAGSDLYQRIFEACRQGAAAGWMCQYEGGGIRYGRVFKPDPALSGYSVDVVDMNDLAGPHHRHPQGEIDLVMPLSGEARFDGRGAGWLVYGPDSAHRPTVSGGQALVLYLLPAGSIEFTRQTA
ncbi:DUF4863 family protein [Bordetella holmesii]|uniref:DUF4863 domain-containing protein n=2 Tax=Bordetella holmesii TaxID=35814 RepID=A0ABN0S4H6_9BORD|nr:DUF4863 family protein [Bordetella holmesii]AHV92902.1 hypothetical protein D560_2018 [Bordetella holmesii ATCC 51541]AIT26673.1 hypothetical protein D558_2003 [Bordetella holmesii 44057]EWM43727.1 hypothetical protein D556_2014 [Bordetella holmesii 41130]EWM47256.1 hypothetical protein D555_2039 [Bordetella holmesii 35009]EWM51413.1 hypothetical protein D557_1266 [Bordetella holmesii 70147]